LPPAAANNNNINTGTDTNIITITSPIASNPILPRDMQ
jgi:hypothetical protein